MSIDDAIAQERSIDCGAGVPRILGVLHYPPTNDKLQPSEFTKIFAEAGASKVTVLCFASALPEGGAA